MWLIFALLFLGVVAVVLGVALAAVLAIAVKLGPVILILIGAWLLLRAIRGPRRDRYPYAGSGPWWQHGRGPAQGPIPSRRPHRAARPPQPAQAPQSTARPAPPPRRELPIDVQVKVNQIQRKADMLLGYADRFPPFSQDLHIVRQTTADYLPRTVEAYLKLTGDRDPIVTATGRTALDELRSQLALLDSKLDEIAQDLQRQDLNRMLANRRFLEERFRLLDQQQESGGPKADISAA